jgi:hypothetical protein
LGCVREVVVEVEVGPAVGVADDQIEGHVQVPELLDAGRVVVG